MSNSPTLRALHDDIRPKRYAIDTDLCTIGRSDMCHIVVPLETISRVHATIERDGPRYVLQDAKSANGIYVNGARVREPHLLTDQDAIGLSKPTPLFVFEDSDTTVRIAHSFWYNDQTMQFYLENQPIDLTPQEFRLLLHLYQHVGEVCDRQSCAEAIWEYPYDAVRDSDRLDRKVSNLRRKLRNLHPDHEDLITTRRGIGYILVV